MDFLHLLGIQPDPSTQPQVQPWEGPGQISATPLPGVAGAINPGVQPTPPATPQEFEARKIGWMEKLTDPNFLRALQYAGSMMMQPVRPGQSKMGNLGRAFTVGRTAYDLGEQEQFARGQAERQETRTQAEHEVGMRTKTAQADIAEATKQDVIDRAKTEAERARFQLQRDQSEETVAAVERQLRARIAEIKQSLPDDQFRKSAIAELERPLAELDRIRSAATASRASAAASGASAALSQERTNQLTLSGQVDARTRKTLLEMPDNEFKDYVTGKGKTGDATIVQAGKFWGEMYDRMTDEERKGKSRERFIKDNILNAKLPDLVGHYQRLLDANPNDPLVPLLRDAIQSDLGMRQEVRGVTPPPAGAPTGAGGDLQKAVEGAGWKYEPNKYDYRIGPSGQVQRKRKG